MSDLLVSNVVKVYPDMIQVVIYHNSYNLNGSATVKKPKLTKDQKIQINIDRSVRRTRTYINDIILCNKFDLWCTFTFDKRKVDRYDDARVRTVMSTWLHTQKKHSPDMQYLIVAERHKRCRECSEIRADSCSHDDRPKALHFHALVKNFNGSLKDSGKKTKRGQTIYNMTGYRAGHTEAVKIEVSDDDYGALANYIGKYITKETPTIYGKKRYWCSQGLDRPENYVNGIGMFNLWNIIKNTKPLYVNEFYEVLRLPYSSHFKNQEKQTSILDVDDFTIPHKQLTAVNTPLLNH